MSSHQGSSRRQKKRKSHTIGQRPTDANHTEQRSNNYPSTTDTSIREKPANTDGHCQTYAEAAAIPPNQAIIPYKPATFHTIDKDNNYAYPFEDIPHLLITCSYPGATLPQYELVFRYIFERGEAATREVLQACHTYAVHKMRKRLGIALTTDAYGDPITVVTKQNTSGKDWSLTGDIRVRFTNKTLGASCLRTIAGPGQEQGRQQ